MDLSFEKLQAAHLARLRLQPSQAAWQERLAGEAYRIQLAMSGFAMAALVDDQVVGAAGLLVQDRHRALAWALVGDVPWRAWPAITRFVATQLDRYQENGIVRVEAYVSDGHWAGANWLIKLGFTDPARMVAWCPDLNDAWCWGRIRRPKSQCAISHQAAGRNAA